MKKLRYYIIPICITAAGAVMLWLALNKGTVSFADCGTVSRMPAIRPDYTGTVIPPNVAPLNFMVLEPGTGYMAKIHSASGDSIDVFSRTGKIKIPLKRWRSLLKTNCGKELFFDVYVRDKNGLWSRYETITNTISKEDIDGYLAYRFMKPLFNQWRNIGIYQRNLGNYENKAVLCGKYFGDGCLNCHTFLNNKPEYMTLGIRTPIYGASTLLVSNNKKVEKIGTRFGYTTWHPSGRLAAYSIIDTYLFYHNVAAEVRDVVDLDSVICYYVVDSEQVKTAPALSGDDRLETYPTWSPDGRYLYYCSAPILWTNHKKVPPEHYDEVKYDLMRVSYDVETDKWGQPETVLSAEKTGMSILLPRISPDGRFLVFCMCKYGCFPIYQASSDLYMMDLQTGQYSKLPINSEYSESWHSFSSNSRWLAFSSKRLDGLFTRTYFSYIDKDGKAYKPFILPQKDPAYYDSLLQTYSVPELIASPVKASQNALARAVRQPEKIQVNMPFTGATVKTDNSGSRRQEQ
ncbi:MAG: cytochrome C biosynthesis protein [Phycisphaerae bacterium]|jgi:Tol biopolymer transport system component